MPRTIPEYLMRHTTTLVRDLFVDWARVGRESYRIVAAFNIGPHRTEAPLLAKLSHHYDFCVLGLSFVKQELARMASPEARAIRDAFDES